MSDSIFNPGPQKIQTLLKVRQGQYKTFLLLWLFYFMSCSRDMAQNVKLSQKMKTEKTEKRWFFLKDDDHRWLFDNQSVGGYYWKTAEAGHFVSQVRSSCNASYEKSQKPRRIFNKAIL